MTATRTEPSGLETGPRVAKVEYGLVRAHALAALGCLLIAATFGVLVATKFSAPEFLGEHAALSWGRLRMNHTQGVFLGFLFNAFLAFSYYASPRLIGSPVFSRRLGWFIFFFWNLGVVLPGWALISAGILQPLEWAEFPLVIDAGVMIAMVCIAVQFFVRNFKESVDKLYISSWYVIGAFTFTMLAYPMGNLAPLFFAGSQGAAFSGLWIHDAVGLFATPMALATIYYIIPAVTRRPIFSHFLSLLGFWLLFFVYPLVGMHHYLLSPLPMDAQLGAIAASLYLGINVLMVVTNLLLSCRGGGHMIGKDISLRFTVTAVIFYLLAGVQGSLMALLPLNRLTHFSDWVVGHSHLALLGFGGFAALGAIGHIWQNTPGVRYSRTAMAWSYWLALCGLVTMVVSLTIVGLLQGELWNLDLPWMASVTASQPYWLLRTASGLVLTAAFVCFAAGLFTGPLYADRRHVSHDLDLQADLVGVQQPPVSTKQPPISTTELRPARTVLAFVAVLSFVVGIVFFGFSILALGIVPSRHVAAEIKDSTPASWRPRTAAEERGREVYASQGCAYCHTQQVRSVVADVRRFGPATENWETQADIPHLFGTRRIGPDLSREAGRRPEDWQFAHLYNPRWVEPDSVMPGYPWLFEGAADRPRGEALDLVAYLQGLGRARLERDRNASEVARAAQARAVHAMAGMEMEAIPPVTDGPPPQLAVSRIEGDVRTGTEVFRERCSGCHGARGLGDGLAASHLLPRPANLTAARFSAERLSDVLWNGVPGTAMPQFRDVPQRDLRALASFVASLGSGEPQPSDDKLLALGRTVFHARCAACHGFAGNGAGPVVGLIRPPADFTRKQPTIERVHSVLVHGIPGTAMTPMQQNMSLSDRDALVVFVRSLFRGAPQKEAAR